MEKTRALGLTANEPDAVRASAGEFILEGLTRTGESAVLKSEDSPPKNEDAGAGTGRESARDAPAASI